MSEPLKPCPFKHTGAELVCTGDGIRSWMACRICGALGPVAHTEAEARAAWNRRAPAALPTREEMAKTIWDALGGWKEWDETHEDSMTETTPIDVRSAADAILSLLRAKEAEG